MLPKSDDFATHFSSRGNGVVSFGNLLFLAVTVGHLCVVDEIRLDRIDQMQQKHAVSD